MVKGKGRESRFLSAFGMTIGAPAWAFKREAGPSPPFAKGASGFGMTIEDAGRKERSRFLTRQTAAGSE